MYEEPGSASPEALDHIKADQDDPVMAQLWELVQQQQRQIAELSRMRAQEPPVQLLPDVYYGPMLDDEGQLDPDLDEEFGFASLEFDEAPPNVQPPEAGPRAAGEFDLSAFAELSFVATSGLGDLNLSYAWLDVYELDNIAGFDDDA
jgi:hypothetical protein